VVSIADRPTTSTQEARRLLTRPVRALPEVLGPAEVEVHARDNVLLNPDRGRDAIVGFPAALAPLGNGVGELRMERGGSRGSLLLVVEAVLLSFELV
jgi:hypothetical protein